MLTVKPGATLRKAGLSVEKSEHATKQFRAGLNCSQAVLGEFAEDLGIDLDTAYRIACGFGGGMGRMAGICGAVTGAIMVIGLAACGPDPRSLTPKARADSLVRSFVERFETEHGATSCRELLGCDISTGGGHAEAQRLGLFETRCSAYVEGAVELLETMFQDQAW